MPENGPEFQERIEAARQTIAARLGADPALISTDEEAILYPAGREGEPLFVWSTDDGSRFATFEDGRVLECFPGTVVEVELKGDAQ